MSGDVIVGPVPNTAAPVPVSSVSADARFALEGVAKNVATLLPSPLTPVLIGNPVQLLNVPLDGVPNAPLKFTSAPAEPTFTASAVATPVPNPDIPVESATCAHAGLFDAPVLERYRVALVSFAKAESVLAADA